jgi:hypothetical protein
MKFERFPTPSGNFETAPRMRLDAFDYVVLAGAGVNVLVFGWLIGYWLTAG